MRKLYWLATLVFVSVLFYQCQKDLSFIGGPDGGASVTPDPITTSIQGNIMDENEQPAVGVAVTAGTSMAITDANGYFHITNAMLDKNTSLITATKDGYFKGYRVLAATSGCNQVVIKLIKKDLAGTVPASSGGEASLSDGAKVSLPANGVVTASSNSDYTGDVKVYASYINPTSSDISKTIPGSLVANDKNGKRVVLSSYGMLAVELSSASGEKLQIKSGSVATLTIPIPSSSASSAPATIPLWYIDEATGIWQEEGTATKQGNNYVGEVKHFSFWNCDYAMDAVNLSLTLQTPAGLPLIYTAVRITATVTSDTSTSTSSAYGYTDSLGQVQGMVPANENLKLEVLGSCNTFVYSQDISPVSQNKDLGIIKITDNSASLLTITGSLTDCNSLPVSNGYAIINFNGTTRYVSVDSNTGIYTTTYAICSAPPTTATILGIDANSQQQGNVTTVGVTAPLTDAGSITACGTSSSEEYINYTLDGIDYILSNKDDSAGVNPDSIVNGYVFNGTITSINGYDINSGNQISFTVLNANAAGTYPINNLFIQNQDSTVLIQPFNVTFTKIATSTGEFFEGSLSGSYTDLSVSHTVSATFRARRNY